VPENRASIERMKAMTVRTSMVVNTEATEATEAHGRTMLYLCIVSDGWQDRGLFCTC
jgi:hypothetical protein